MFWHELNLFNKQPYEVSNIEYMFPVYPPLYPTFEMLDSNAYIISKCNLSISDIFKWI